MHDKHHPDEEYLALLERAMDGFSMHRSFGWYTMANRQTGGTTYEIYDLSDGILVEKNEEPTREKARRKAMVRAELYDDKRHSKKWQKQRYSRDT